MDTFDVRKFITEAKISEQKKAFIEYEDGTTEDRQFHQSVSDDKIKKMFKVGTYIDGKLVQKVLVGDSLDQAMNESPAMMKDRLESLLAYYEAETGEEPDSNIRREISTMVANGKDNDAIKDVIININNINEAKDVIEPEDVPDIDADNDDDEFQWDYDEKEVEKVKPKIENKVASLIVNAYDDENPPQELEKNTLLRAIKNYIEDKDPYYQMIHDEGVEFSLNEMLIDVAYSVVKDYIETKKVTETFQTNELTRELKFIFDKSDLFSRSAAMLNNIINKQKRDVEAI